MINVKKSRAMQGMWLLLMVLTGCRGHNSNREKAIAQNNHGYQKLQLGQYDSAIADFDEATRLDSTYDVPFNNRGLAYFNKGDLDKAGL